jgi:hypothetical protein
MRDQEFVSRARKVAYENPSLRRDLLPLIKEAMEFASKEEMEQYLKDHPKADPKNHKVVEPKLPKNLEEKTEGMSSKAKKALTSLFSSATEGVKDFFSSKEKAKEMCVEGSKAVGNYLKNTLVGEDENGNLSIKKGAIGKAIGDEVHHVSDFAKGSSTLIKSALGKEVSEEEKKEAKGQLAHSAWGMSVLAGKVMMAGFAASGAGSIGAVVGYAGKKFGMKLGIHLAIASLTRSGNFANGVGTMQMIGAVVGSEEKEDSFSSKYGKKAKGEKDKATILVLDLVSDMAEDLKNLSQEDILNLVEQTATGSDEEKLSEDQVDKIIEGLTKSLKTKAKAPKKASTYAELDIAF